MRVFLLLLSICFASQKALALGDTAAPPPNFSLVAQHNYSIVPAAESDSNLRWKRRPFGRPPFHERLYRPEGNKGPGLMIGGGAVILVGVGLLIAGASLVKTEYKGDESGEFAVLGGGILAAGGLAMTLVGIGVNDRWLNRHRRKAASANF